jgi:hypothetical protein
MTSGPVSTLLISWCLIAGCGTEQVDSGMSLTPVMRPGVQACVLTGAAYQWHVDG